jgi:hypothetical protein
MTETKRQKIAVEQFIKWAKTQGSSHTIEGIEVKLLASYESIDGQVRAYDLTANNQTETITAQWGDLDDTLLALTHNFSGLDIIYSR